MSWTRGLAFLAFMMATGHAFAAPSSSCASKFVGTWQHSTSNIATLTRDGRAICSGNAFCQQGTWDCSGNSLTYVNSAGSYVYTLQPNGTMTLGSIVVTRIGAAPKSAPSEDRFSKEAIAKREGDSFMQQGKSLERDLRTSSRQYAEQEWQQAINRYSSAAECYEIAGDHELAARAKREENRLRNSTLASLATKKDPDTRKKYTKQQCAELKRAGAVIAENGGSQVNMDGANCQ